MVIIQLLAIKTFLKATLSGNYKTIFLQRQLGWRNRRGEGEKCLIKQVYTPEVPKFAQA